MFPGRRCAARGAPGPGCQRREAAGFMRTSNNLSLSPSGPDRETEGAGWGGDMGMRREPESLRGTAVFRPGSACCVVFLSSTQDFPAAYATPASRSGRRGGDRSLCVGERGGVERGLRFRAPIPLSRERFRRTRVDFVVERSPEGAERGAGGVRRSRGGGPAAARVRNGRVGAVKGVGNHAR